MLTDKNGKMKRTQLEKLQKLTVYKRAHLQKKYNLQPAIPDKDYSPLATTPSNTSQSELYDMKGVFEIFTSN